MEWAAWRPSAMAQTIRLWPRVMSPAVKTLGTLVRLSASALTLPIGSSSTPSCSSMPFRSGPTKPIASRTRSAG